MSILLNRGKLHPMVRECLAYVIWKDNWQLRADVKFLGRQITAGLEDLSADELPKARRKLIRALEKEMLAKDIKPSMLEQLPPARPEYLPDWKALSKAKKR